MSTRMSRRICRGIHNNDGISRLSKSSNSNRTILCSNSNNISSSSSTTTTTNKKTSILANPRLRRRQLSSTAFRVITTTRQQTTTTTIAAAAHHHQQRVLNIPFAVSSRQISSFDTIISTIVPSNIIIAASSSSIYNRQQQRQQHETIGNGGGSSCYFSTSTTTTAAINSNNTNVDSKKSIHSPYPSSSSISSSTPTVQELDAKTDHLLHQLTHTNHTSSSPSSIPNTKPTTTSRITRSHVDELMESWSKHHSTLYAANRTEDLLRALEANFDRLYQQQQQQQQRLDDGNGMEEDVGLLVIPNAISYNHVCHAYARAAAATTDNNNKERMMSSDNDAATAARRAEYILDGMLERCHRHILMDRTDDRRRSSSSSSSRSRRYSHRLPVPPEPTVTTFNIVMNAWAKTKCRRGSSNSSTRSSSNSNNENESGGGGGGAATAGFGAERVFGKMEQWVHDCTTTPTSLNTNSDGGTNRSGVYHGARPNARSLSTVLDAWGRAVEETTTTTTEYNDDDDDHSSSSADDALNRIMTILYHAVETRRDYVASMRRGEVDEAEEIDHEYGYDGVGGSSNSNPANIQLNVICFHSVLHALALTIRRHSSSSSSLSSMEEKRKTAEKAEEVFGLLQNLYESGDLELEDDGASDTMDESLLDAATSPNDTASSSSSLKPNTRTYSLLVQCWANAAGPTTPSDNSINTTTTTNKSTATNSGGKSMGEYAAQRAESILTTMEDHYLNGGDGGDIKPNAITYTSCIAAWSRCRSVEGSKRAVALLERMENLYGDVDGDGVEEGEEDWGEVKEKPNVALYNACLSAICRSSSTPSSSPRNNITNPLMDNMERANTLLTRMERRNMVDVTSYNTVLDGYAKRMRMVRSNSTTGSNQQQHQSYNRRGGGGGGNSDTNENDKNVERAWDLFQRMQEGRPRRPSPPSNDNGTIGNGGDEAAMLGVVVSPDIITYNTIMDVVARSRRPDSIQRTTKLLDEMMMKMTNGGDTAIVTTTTITAVLNACAWSPLDEKAAPANDVFQRFGQQIMTTAKTTGVMIQPKMDVVALASFLSALANQGGNAERRRYALILALGTYERHCIHRTNDSSSSNNNSSPYIAPNAYVFMAMMKACGRLSKDVGERGRLLERIFGQCQGEGQVSRSVLRMFLKSSPKLLSRKILRKCHSGNDGRRRDDHDDKYYRIPLEWCRNTSQRDRPSVHAS